MRIIRVLLYIILSFFQLYFFDIKIVIAKIFIKNKEKLDKVINRDLRLTATRLVKFLIRDAQIDLKVRNELAHLPEKFILVCNHQSFFDIMVLIYIFKNRQLRFVAKNELKNYFPGTTLVLKMQKHAFIERGNFGQAINSIKDMVLRCNNGADMCPVIFPEGTRAKDGELNEFQAGGIKTAMKYADMPIVVVTMDGGHYLSHIKKLYKTRYKEHVTYFNIIISKVFENKKTRKEQNQLIQDFHDEIDKNLKRMRDPNNDILYKDYDWKTLKKQEI